MKGREDSVVSLKSHRKNLLFTTESEAHKSKFSKTANIQTFCRFSVTFKTSTAHYISHHQNALYCSASLSREGYRNVKFTSALASCPARCEVFSAQHNRIIIGYEALVIIIKNSLPTLMSAWCSYKALLFIRWRIHVHWKRQKTFKLAH